MSFMIYVILLNASIQNDIMLNVVSTERNTAECNSADCPSADWHSG